MQRQHILPFCNFLAFFFFLPQRILLQPFWRGLQITCASANVCCESVCCDYPATSLYRLTGAHTLFSFICNIKNKTKKPFVYSCRLLPYYAKIYIKILWRSTENISTSWNSSTAIALCFASCTGHKPVHSLCTHCVFVVSNHSS